LAECGLKSRSKGAYTTLLIAANLPDLDGLAHLVGAGIALDTHRGITHSLFAWPVLAAVTAGLMWLCFRKRGAHFGVLWTVAMIGIGVHLLLDLSNSYGMKLLAPFSNAKYALDWAFVVEPLVLLPLALVPIWFRWMKWGQKAARITIVWMLGLLAFRGAVHAITSEQVANEFASTDGNVEVSVMPYPISPVHWRTVVAVEDSILIGNVSSFAPHGTKWQTVPSDDDHPAAGEAEKDSTVAAFLRFARHPVYTVEEDGAGGWLVTIRDLRFEYFGRNPFAVEARLFADSTIVSRRVRFQRTQLAAALSRSSRAKIMVAEPESRQTGCD
jgi:inner membrane protein